MILPSGMDPSDVNAHSFAVYVHWQGHLGWTVTGAHKDERLSVKGRKWTWYVERRNRRFYYFPDYDTALAAAIEVVDARVINGCTWAQWVEKKATS